MTAEGSATNRHQASGESSEKCMLNQEGRRGVKADTEGSAMARARRGGEKGRTRFGGNTPQPGRRGPLNSGASRQLVGARLARPFASRRALLPRTANGLAALR